MIYEGRLFCIKNIIYTLDRSFAGCSNKEADKSKSNELVLFNAKGENEAEFEEMCKAFTEETGIPTKWFSTCNGTNQSFN